MNAPRGIDIGALTAYLRDIGLPHSSVDITLIPGGKSNLTYLLQCDDEAYVLRRPPLGHVLATAHDMAREYRVIEALGPTLVPVPASIAFCGDQSVLGAPFYIMERVEGQSFRWHDELLSRPTAWIEGVAEAMMGALAELHRIDPASVGLADFGRPEGYLQRQVRTWGRQHDSSSTREVIGLDHLREAVTAKVPNERSFGIVHGDFRLDNLLVSDDGEVQAIVDWEMATLGDPLADLALTLAYGELARRQRAAGIFDGLADASTAPGFPSDDELIDAYVIASGEPVGLSELSWYLGMSYYKLAVILEGIYLRHKQGQTVGEGFDSAGDIVRLAVDAGLDSMKVRI